MEMYKKEVDVAQNIKIIESLKCELLSDLSQLYTGMSNPDYMETQERDDILANMIMVTYMLAKKLGVPYHTLDLKILNKLKVGIIQNGDNEWYKEIAGLSRHIEKSRKLDID